MELRILDLVLTNRFFFFFFTKEGKQQQKQQQHNFLQEVKRRAEVETNEGRLMGNSIGA